EAGEPELAARRRAVSDDFLRSHAAAEVVAHLNEDALTVRDALTSRGIDRAEAWEAALHAVVNAEEQTPEQVEADFAAAARRWEDGAELDNVDPAQSQSSAEAALRTAFPGAEITVTGRDDAWGRWLVLEWTDGPTEQHVTDVAKQFVGVQEDSGRAVRHAFYGISTWRDYSAEAIADAERAFAAAGIRRDEKDPEYVTGIAEDASIVEVAGQRIDVSFDAPLESLVKAFLDSRDL
ncbi:MAG: hypothetical protein V4755_09830, partial [Curtobacterium sp.]